MKAFKRSGIATLLLICSMYANEADINLQELDVKKIESLKGYFITEEEFNKQYKEKKKPIPVKVVKKDSNITDQNLSKPVPVELEKIIVEKCEYDKLSVFSLINEGITKNKEIISDKKKENRYVGVLLKKLKKYTFLEYELIEKELFKKGLDVNLLKEIKSVIRGRV